MVLFLLIGYDVVGYGVNCSVDEECVVDGVFLYWC